MKIKITRKKKKLVARIIPYYCIINYELKNFKKYINQEGYALNEDAMKNINYNPLSLKLFKNMPRKFNIENFKAYLDNINLGETVKIVPLKNGETKSIDINNQKTTIYIVSFTSNGVVFGNEIYIDQDLINKSYIVETKYNWKTGCELFIDEE